MHHATRPIARVVALALALSATLSACGDDADSLGDVIAPSVARAANDAGQLAQLREVTARFHSIDAAKAAGYSTQITPCWTHHAKGGMGYHFGNTSLFDATADLLHPETVMYEPQTGGHMKLVGMEYIVPIDAWSAAGHDLADTTDVPQLLGQRFTRHSALPIFKLHIWLWRDNPSGTFADWNPKVSCQRADSTEVF